MSLEQHVLVMALAAIQADGKTIAELSQAEKEAYIFSAAEDLKLALDVIHKQPHDRPGEKPQRES